MGLREAMVQEPLLCDKCRCAVGMSILYTEYRVSSTLSTAYALCQLGQRLSGEPLFGVKHMGKPFVGWDNAFSPGVNE